MPVGIGGNTGSAYKSPPKRFNSQRAIFFPCIVKEHELVIINLDRSHVFAVNALDDYFCARCRKPRAFHAFDGFTPTSGFASPVHVNMDPEVSFGRVRPSNRRMFGSTTRKTNRHHQPFQE